MCVQVAYARVGDIEEAEDLAQEALITAIVKLDQLREPRAFRSWLRRIVLSKTRGLRSRPPLVENADSAADATPDALSGLLRQQQLDLLSAGLHALSDPTRSVARLFYQSRLPQGEICRLLGVPLTTVKKRLHDARSSLRRLLIPTDQAAERLAVVGHLRTTARPASRAADDSLRVLAARYRSAFKLGQTNDLESMVAPGYVHELLDGTRADKTALLSASRRRLVAGVGPRARLSDSVVADNVVLNWHDNFPGQACFALRFAGGRLVESSQIPIHTQVSFTQVSPS